METITSHPDHILEEIQHYNLRLNKSVLKGNHQEGEEIMEYPSQLTPLLLALVKTLGQHLEFTTKVLQNSCQLLNMVYHQREQEGSCTEWESLAKWLQGLNTQLLRLVEDLGRSGNELLGISSGKPVDVQRSPDGSGNAQSDGDKEELDMALRSSTHQLPSLPPSLPLSEENQLVELEKRVPFEEKELEKEEEVLLSSENPNKSEELCLGPKNDGEKEPYSAEIIHENLISGDSGKNIMVSPNPEEVIADHLKRMPTQETKAEIKETVDETERETCNPLRKSETINEDFDQKRRNDGTGQSLEESSGRPEDWQESRSMVPLIDKLEEEKDAYSKEFFTKANELGEAELSCSVTAPWGVLERLTVTVVNDLSPFVVNDAEELVSNVISAECSSVDQLTASPISIAIPFASRYRGMYKDIMVKVTDVNFQSIYLTPTSLEGHQGSQKGSAAVVKTSQLGLFAAVSCLKKETWTVPRKGILRKLHMDPRISFSYPSSTFGSRVTVGLKVQPIDQSTLSMLKMKHDEYYPVMSTSSLIHMEYSSLVPFNRAITVVLPCPPNPEKRREGIETDAERAISASVPGVTSIHHFRALSASSRKHREKLKEPLKVLGYRNREEGWVLLDDIPVRNARNGLVSFDLDQPLERFIIVRLSSTMDNIQLVQFIQNLENAIHNILVRVVLHQNEEDPYKIMVLLVPSKELNMELQCLCEEGYCGPPEPSKPFKMREGEQVYFRFSGNIFASDDGNTYGKNYRLAFHAQRKPRLALWIKEIDEFGNYSSPHYKGTALFYKVAKDTILNNVDPLLLEDHEEDSFLCKLALTLPKKEKLISRPQSTKRISTDISEVMWDNLLYWLSEELSEENANSLAQYLPLHRSTLQFIKLKCPENLTEQIYELLCFWRRSLPRSANKLKLLSRYLGKIGRNDLVQHLQLKWTNQSVMKKIHR
ncbi:death domain-containing protein 1 isoform X2 [Crotalus tigris]|uniref:death domain-containing protein 1 isoform X2 n=1 Tax=Crotalus tigris TaxID=88082 RepID=UPI00192F666E|nr:death domain-containing protein 1 isoform X2 [Crotalus tigris]